MVNLRFGHMLPAALLITVGVSCSGSPTSGGGWPPARSPQITGATLVAAAEGVLVGSNLRPALQAAISVDGHPVVVTARTTTEIRFGMPAPRSCEVDGRPIPISAGTASFTGRLTVPSVLRMQPGESRILSRSDSAPRAWRSQRRTRASWSRC